MGNSIYLSIKKKSEVKINDLKFPDFIKRDKSKKGLFITF